jgi:pilus assembly protein Flp/PilA
LGGHFNVCLLCELSQSEDGATAIEYGLIAALIAVAAVTVMATVGTNLSSTFNTVASALSVDKGRPAQIGRPLLLGSARSLREVA